ncbi:DUF551 domain-containing protein, partial [Salmonella enterica]
FHIADQQVGGTSDYIKDGEWPIDNGVIEVYAAPPATVVPVVPDECPAELLAFCEQVIDSRITANAKADELWNACRTAMLQAGNSPSKCSLRDGIEAIRNSGIPVDVDKIQSECEAGNSPVIPCGWVSCSERMPDREYVLAGDFSGTHYLASIPNVQVGIYADWFDDGKHCWDDGDGNDLHLKEVTHWMPLPEPPQEVK